MFGNGANLTLAVQYLIIRNTRSRELEKYVSTRFLGFARNDTIFFFSVMLSLSKHPGEAACLVEALPNPCGGMPSNKKHSVAGN